MSTEKPLLDALNVSVIVDRKDQPGQVSRTEWRTDIVLQGGTPAQAGDLAMLGPNGQFDPSVIPGGSSSTISVNGTPVSNPNLNDNTPTAPPGFANVTWQFDLSGNVSAYYQSTTVAVNGAPVTNPNFNNATPSAPPGFANVVWQTDVNGNISGYISTGGGSEFTTVFPDDTASDIPGYGILTEDPETSVEQVETATVTTTGVPVAFSPENSYVTLRSTGLTVIPAGTWTFGIWTSVNSTSGNSQCAVRVEVYARTTGGSETLLFTVTTPTITSTTPQLLEVAFAGADYIVNPTDRGVAKYYAIRTAGLQTRTVSFYHAGSTHLSRITAPIPSITFVPFNDISSGVNTQATMVVDTGATLTFANSGVVNANELYNTPVVSNAPTTKQALVFNGTAWAPADIVNSFNGRTGDVLPASGDYSYAQISGTPQLPQTFNAITHEFLNSYSAVTGLFTAVQPSAADLTNGTTGTGAVALQNSPIFTGTISATNVAISGTLADGTNSPGTAGYILSSTGTGTLWIPNTAGTVPFNDITSGTNTTATMVVGSGASLSFSGAGIVNANELYGVAISSTPPIAGQVLTATSPTTAAWQNPSTGTANFAQAIVDFSNPLGPEETTASVTVPAPWVTGVSVIMCNPFGGSTPDHGPEDAMVENLAAYATNIIPGVSFDIECYAPNGTWGRYLINAIGS